MTRSSSLTRPLTRIVAGGVLAASVVAAGSLLLERTRFGATDAEAIRRVERELHARFEDTAAALADRAARVSRASAAIDGAERDTAGVRDLFQALAAEVPGPNAGMAGVTVYSARGTPLAWAGRVSDMPRDRLAEPAGLFVAVDALGPRLVRTDPVPDPDRPSGPRLATIVTEQLVLERTDIEPSLSDSYQLPTSVVDVTFRAASGAAPPDGPYAFAVRGPSGEVLAQASVAPEDILQRRQRWRAHARALALLVLSVTVLLCAAPLLERRRHATMPGAFALLTISVVMLLAGGRLLLRMAADPLVDTANTGLLELVPDALLLAALVWLALDAMERRRVSKPRAPLVRTTPAAWAVTFAGFAAAGAGAAAALWGYEIVLSRIAARTPHDLLRFSLHPFDIERLGTAAGLVLLNAAVVWGGAAIVRLPAILWRTPRQPGIQAARVLAVIAGAAVVLAIAGEYSAGLPLGPLATAVGVSAIAAALLSRPRGGWRRASQAGRLGLFFTGLAVPALVLYPSLNAYAVASKERLVSGTFAPLVANQRDDLQSRQVPLALEAIDASPSLVQLVTGSDEDAAPTTDRAFLVWSPTVLSTSRTTSAVELYGPNGRLVSRFALNLPEYGATEYRGGSCTDWELYEEVSPFGSSLRYVLRASRAVCRDHRRVGGIVVRAQLDYRALPFTSVANPYLEWLTPERRERPEAEFGSDVELVIYGWSRAPLYASGTAVWPLSEEMFSRMIASRDPQWVRVVRDGAPFRVYFFNDRGGIYALGYPTTTAFGHLVNLGELVFLAGVMYAALLVGATLFTAFTAQSPASGRALLREVRSSFYRKLFIAFVAAAVVPVVVLALATSTYFANQFRAGVEESAVKTATVAQRLVEDYVALQQRGAGSLDRIDDEFMLLVRRAIDEDVNLFDGARLQATSERPLFASRLLPARTPADVYRAIALDRLPTTVVIEEVGGAAGFLVAAAPVRAGSREGIVTVPQTLRQREIEAQIDEIDRRVLSAAVLFVLLGSALGYWMAERIADPVSRLTRATRRIARGDLDARIAATSSDELRRLVEDFNQMAQDLKRQRRELERTQRLEAWADMARQVAHDIKNPLTPIQLSAEHARRVNIDKGRPLSPVLDDCVNAILSQVKLLRQISSEFSSFASSPTARPEAADIGQLIDEVVEPYRTGLASRVGLEVSVAAQLPRVLVDRTLFVRALTNVIENALHAMPGGGRLAVRANLVPPPSSSDAPQAVAVEVEDSGVGMDAAALARIFEPYFSTKATGTGLGLTIAKRNVELMGGSIAVRSEPGVGTVVSLQLTVTA